MQPFPELQPRRRGSVVAIALLTAALVFTTTTAIVQHVQLRAARERIEELEKAAEGSSEPDDSGGFLENLFEDLLGENPLEGLFEEGGPFGDLGAQAGDLQCIVSGAGEGRPGEAPRDVPGIAAEVERLRGLRFERPPQPEFLPGDETARRVQELFLEEYTEEVADVEERILVALGAVPAGTDLRELRSRALGEQVAGFYEPETGELVVRQTGGEPTGTDLITLAHELDHALTDQRLGIPLPDDPELGREDANLAALALVEGDATLVMQRYALSLPLDDQLGLSDPGALAEAQAGLEKLPPYLQQELLFPYQDGMSFVCDLFADGGWEAVNRAYDAPPTTTAQILFPERYDAGEGAIDPRDPGPLRGAWRRAASLELGAANLLWLFQAPGGDTAASLDGPREGAAAWAGGELDLWTRGEATGVGVSLAERDGSDVLCSAMSHWYAAAFREATASGSAFRDGLVLESDPQDAVLTCEQDEVRLGIGPDVRTARALAR